MSVHETNRAKDRAPVPRLSYRLTEAAAATGVSVDTLYRRIESGTLKARKSGKITVIAAGDLQAFVESLPDFKSQAA